LIKQSRDSSSVPFTVAVDFDGTLTEDAGWSEVRDLKIRFGAATALTRFRELGWYIIIWTCREQDPEIAELLKQNAVPFDDINWNEHFGGRPGFSNKIVADLYIDDRGFRFEGDWPKTLKEVEKLASQL